jgi:glycerol-3-phosphate dehydrogenase
MAEEAVDVVCERLGVIARCITAETPLPPAQGLNAWSRDAALQPTLFGKALLR